MSICFYFICLEAIRYNLLSPSFNFPMLRTQKQQDGYRKAFQSRNEFHRREKFSKGSVPHGQVCRCWNLHLELLLWEHQILKRGEKRPKIQGKWKMEIVVKWSAVKCSEEIVLGEMCVLSLTYRYVAVCWGTPQRSCWVTALQVGRLRVRFPIVSLEFFIDIILSAALWHRDRLSL